MHDRAPLRSKAGPERRPAVAQTLAHTVSAAQASPAQQVQRRLGNQGAQQWVARASAPNAPPVQLSSAVSSPHEPAELEAQAVARTVMRMTAPAPGVARVGSDAGATSPQRQADGSAPRAPAPVGHLSGGAPLPAGVRTFMEPRFGARFDHVRVHTGGSAAQLSRDLGAQAFTVGQHVVFGQGRFQPDTHAGKELIAHELTHTIQQGASIQRSAETAVAQRSPPRIQRLGISDALDHFADKANLIPGFRMFTIILGVNPINMSRVERSAANILRALIEFIPGGSLITQALDNHGIFDRVGGWIDQQIRTLGMTGAVIRQAIDTFLNSLRWRDILRLGDVWDRAKRIFTEPIDRLIAFARGLVTGIIAFIREAILLPLARLAEGTRGYDLLKAVLGEDPITGQPVPRNAETLIGGFMRLIGQEEIWENIKRANAAARAWAWFQGALAGLLGFVRQIPTLFVNAFRALELVDLILVPRAFTKLVGVFGGFIVRFLSWAGNTVWSLLEIIFEVVAPAVIPYLQRAAGAFRTILRNPIGFVRNLVRAGVLGLQQFAGNFLTHLRASLIGWLTGAMSGANIYIPQAFTLREIIKFVLSVLGLTWQNIRQKLVRAIGEPAMAVLERGFDIVVTLVREGPAAAWEKIQESLTNLREMVMEQIMTFVRDRIVQAAITRLVTSLNPAGAFIQAIIAIYNTVMFFVERLRQIAQVAAAVIDSISAIASGVVTEAANRVEQTMAGLLTLVISFLARLVGLGNVSDAVVNIINRIRAPIDRALDRVVAWIVAQARRLGRAVAQAGVPQDPNQRLRLGLDAAVAAVNALRGPTITEALINPALAAIRIRYGFSTLRPVARGDEWWIEGVVNPSGQARSAKAAGSAEAARSGAANIQVGDEIQVSGAKWWHAVVTTVVPNASIQYQGDAGRGQLAFASYGTQWRRYVPEAGYKTGAAWTAIKLLLTWGSFADARQALNYRAHGRFNNPAAKQWHHIHENSAGGPNSVTNLALTLASNNQNFNVWFGQAQPGTGNMPLRQWLIGKPAATHVDWGLRCITLHGLTVTTHSTPMGPYQTIP